MAQQVKPVNSRELIAQALGIKLFSGFEDPEQLIPDLDSSLNIALDKISSLQNVIAVLFSLCPGSTDTIIRTPLCDVPVHCAILNIWTPQFKTMLESGMAESRSKVIEINHESPCYVKQMVDFMYTAGTLMDNKNVFPLLRLACCYEIVALRDQCIDYLLDNISLENCVQLFDISVQHEDENVPKWKTMKEIALKFVKRNRMEILLSPTPFDSITPASIKELIAAWDKKEDMFSRTHAVLLGKAIKVWCNLQWQVSRFPSIIEHLDNMKHAGSTQFFVKLDSRSIPVCTSHGKTVYNLKCYIEDIEGIPVEYQKLQFNSTVLTNDLDLANCGITQDCTVYLKIRQANKKKDHNNKYKVDYGPFNIVYQLCIQALIRGFETEHVDLMKLDHYAITEIFASKYLNVSSELEVASFLETWLNYSPNRKKPIIVNRVVALLRLEHIPTRNLLSMRESHPSIASSSDFSYRVKSALKHQVNPEFRANVTPKRKHYVDEQSNSDTIVSFLFEKFNEPKKSREHD